MCVCLLIHTEDRRSTHTSNTIGALYHLVKVEFGQVVVQVDGRGAQVSAQQSGVRGEHGGHIEVTRAGEDQADAGQPLVEVRDHRGYRVWLAMLQVLRELQRAGRKCTTPYRQSSSSTSHLTKLIHNQTGAICDVQANTDYHTPGEQCLFFRVFW